MKDLTKTKVVWKVDGKDLLIDLVLHEIEIPKQGEEINIYDVDYKVVRVRKFIASIEGLKPAEVHLKKIELKELSEENENYFDLIMKVQDVKELRYHARLKHWTVVFNSDEFHVFKSLQSYRLEYLYKDILDYQK